MRGKPGKYRSQPVGEKEGTLDCSREGVKVVLRGPRLVSSVKTKNLSHF